MSELLGVSSYKDPNKGHTFTPHVILILSLKEPSPNTATMKVRAPTQRFGPGQGTQTFRSQ